MIGGAAMPVVLLALYLWLGYWAVGKTLWRNKIVVGNNLFFARLFIGALAGFIIIPVALIMSLFGK
jgi:hypothetical protein